MLLLKLFLLLFLLGLETAAVSGALDHIAGYDISSGLELNTHLEEEHQRHLAGICIIGTTKTYYFEVTIRLEPDSDTTDVCLLADQVLLGHDINLLLLDYGIGAAGADDDAVFLAGVCPQPSSTGRRKLVRRMGYVWTGGGGCRGCFGDSRDGRNLQEEGGQRQLATQVTGSSEEGWFTDIYAPWLEEQLETAIANEIVPNHRECLGENPEHIDVEIVEIQLQDLELGCDDGQVIETLQSLSFQDEPLRERDCTKCASVDFSRYEEKKGKWKTLEKGDYVKDKTWLWQHGFTVSASGGYNPNFEPRIVDTGDQACTSGSSSDSSSDSGSSSSDDRKGNGRLNLGEGCNNNGRGKGGKGSSRKCDPIGNVLIVQESKKDCPDANPLGGTIKFEFDTPVLVSDIGLMDVDEAEQRIKITYDDGVTETFTYPGLDDNAVQRVICNKLNVKILEVIFPGTGAITGINFCPECRPLKKNNDPSSHCLTTEGGDAIEGIEEIAFDDFEDPDYKTAVHGWKHATVDKSETQGFTRFLGRYGKRMRSPYKTYRIPRDAELVTIDIDFYEIDKWENKKDYAEIYVDGEKIKLGPFEGKVDEGTTSGTTPHGITWTRTSIGKPAYLGFAEKELDQKHHLTIQVPQNTGLLKDGKLRLTLNANLKGDIKKSSAGWDNVRVGARRGCQKSKLRGPRKPGPASP